MRGQTFGEFSQLYIRLEPIAVEHSVPEEVEISVIVQAYNHEKYIEQCIESIITQKVNVPFEIIIHEDASSDSTRDICQQLAKKYPNKIRLFLGYRENNIQINGFPTGRFGRLFNTYQSYGKYVAICEGDDFWNSTRKLAKQYKFLENNKEYVVVWNRTRVKYEGESLIKLPDNKFYKNKSGHIVGLTLRDLILYQPVQTSSIFIRKDCINNSVYEEYGIDLDINLFTQLLLSGKGAVINEYLSVYRRNQESMWTSLNNMKKLTLMEDIYMAVDKQISIRTGLEKERVLIRKKLICRCLLESDYTKASVYIRQLSNKDIIILLPEILYWIMKGIYRSWNEVLF